MAENTVLTRQAKFKNKYPILVFDEVDENTGELINNTRPFSFGIKRAKMILEKIESIKQFIEESENNG